MMSSSEYLGHVAECHLTRTFRFGERVQTPSIAFIQANPEQSRRELKPAKTTMDRGVSVVRARTQEAGLARSLMDIAEHAGDSESTVLVLGRFNKSRAVMPAGLGTESPGLEFSTVHRAKGREADYVVVLDLKDGYDGFPSKITDDPVLQMVLPPVSGQPYPFSEERRLFYVAVTRSRRGTYLVTDFRYPSGFVDELQKLDSRIEVLGPPPVKCPQCREGTRRDGDPRPEWHRDTEVPAVQRGHDAELLDRAHAPVQQPPDVRWTGSQMYQLQHGLHPGGDG